LDDPPRHKRRPAQKIEPGIPSNAKPMHNMEPSFPSDHPSRFLRRRPPQDSPRDRN